MDLKCTCGAAAVRSLVHLDDCAMFGTTPAPAPSGEIVISIKKDAPPLTIRLKRGGRLVGEIDEAKAEESSAKVPGPPFRFARYHNGEPRAEGVKINLAATLEEAIPKAVRLCRDPGCTVLVYKPPIAAPAEARAPMRPADVLEVFKPLPQDEADALSAFVGKPEAEARAVYPEWRPISEAEQAYGAPILLGCVGKYTREGYWGSRAYNRSTKAYEQGWVFSPGTWPNAESEPTHFAPLPTPPKAEADHG